MELNYDYHYFEINSFCRRVLICVRKRGNHNRVRWYHHQQTETEVVTQGSTVVVHQTLEETILFICLEWLFSYVGPHLYWATSGEVLQLLDHLIMWLLLQGSQKIGVEQHHLLGGHYSLLYLWFLQQMLVVMLRRNSRNCKNCCLVVALSLDIVGDSKGRNQIIGNDDWIFPSIWYGT